MMHRAMVAALFLLTGCGQATTDIPAAGGTDAAVRLDGAAALPDGTAAQFSDRIDVAKGRGIYTANRGGALTRIEFPLDEKRIDPARGHMFAPVGESADGIVVLVDEYGTRTNDGHCANGTETFVRVFSLSDARELLAVPAGSCLDGVPRPTREATWLPPDRFRVETKPARTYVLSGGDVVKPVGAKDGLEGRDTRP